MQAPPLAVNGRVESFTLLALLAQTLVRDQLTKLEFVSPHAVRNLKHHAGHNCRSSTASLRWSTSMDVSTQALAYLPPTASTTFAHLKQSRAPRTIINQSCPQALRRLERLLTVSPAKTISLPHLHSVSYILQKYCHQEAKTQQPKDSELSPRLSTRFRAVLENMKEDQAAGEEEELSLEAGH